MQDEPRGNQDNWVVSELDKPELKLLPMALYGVCEQSSAIGIGS